MQAVLDFIADIEKVVDAIFALIEKIMGMVEEFNAEDAE